MKNSQSNKICTRCVADTTIPNISFDKEGVCNFCYLHNEMEKEYPQGKIGAQKLKEIVQEIKNKGQGKKYNCIVGVSGGRDSSFLLYMAVKLGLKPLAVHFDNGWDSPIAVTNIKKSLEKLKIDLETIVVNWEEFKDLQISYLKASVPDAEIPTDVGILGTLHRVAIKEGIKYILNGHSFRTEGVQPLGWTYMDGKYIVAIQKKFGKYPLKTYPNVNLSDLAEVTWQKIKTVPLINYVEYNHTKVQKILEKELDWTYYGGHHQESYYTNFFQSYLLPKKFGIDKRKIEYSALIRSGQMTRENALLKIKTAPVPYEDEMINYVISKLWMTRSEFNKIMALPAKTFHDYPTYYPLIRAFKWPMKMTYKLNLFPKLLYQKLFPKG
ncbi:MAG: N-acetyl sugar amidotransferase [Patescibacteria group bacterium]|nr:N-acetyl sugar amidotransferase [Patescibacteria group bacterium]